MAFFGKKKNTDPAQDPSKESVTENENAGSNGDEKPGKKRARKKKSPLSQILHESVWETVQGDFRDNVNFMGDYEGKTWYVGIVLHTKDIGGLDKRSKKDEAKGTLVECINSGRLKTYITEDLMDGDMIMFIPDPMTLSEMEEFSILHNAPYEVALVNTSGDIVMPGGTIEYESAIAVATGETKKGRNDSTDINSYIPEEEKNDDDIPAVLDNDADLLDDALVSESKPSENHIAGLSDKPDNKPESVVTEDQPVIEDDPDDDIPDIDDDIDNMDGVEPLPEDPMSSPVMNSSVNAGVNPVSGPDPINVSGFNGTVDPNFTPASEMNAGGAPDAYSMAMQDQPVQEVENEVPSEWTNQMLVRRFYSDELGLEVSTGPFDAQFLANNPVLYFDTERPSGWLNEQLNEMSRLANMEMQKLHDQHLYTLRNRYFRLLALACDRIRKDLSVSSTDNQYGVILENLKRELDDSRDNISVQVNRKKEEMEHAWRMKLQEIGIDAARAAQHQYRERYGKQHEEDIYNIENIVKAGIEADFNESVHELYERRRNEAGIQLDLNITEILNELADQYTSDLAIERDLYQQLRAEMDAFLEENRKADIVHTRTLEEELRQTEKADAVLAEQTAKIRAMCEEHKQKRQSLLDEIQKIRDDNQAEIDALNREHDFKLEQMRNENEILQTRLNEMMDKYANIDKTKGEEYESRLSELKEQVLSWEDKCTHLAEVHKRSNLTSVFFVISAVIASLFIGFVGGEFVNINRQTKQEYQSIVKEQQKDEGHGSLNSDLKLDESEDEDDADTSVSENDGFNDLSDADPSAKKTSKAQDTDDTKTASTEADVPIK